MAIYFVQCGAGGPIKIGFSDNPTVRVPQIQVNHWQELTLLGVQDGTDADERALHARFSYVWIRGEWHWPAPELLDHITKYTVPPTPKWSPTVERSERPPPVGGSLRELFRAKGVRQRDMAKALGVSEPTMSCWASRQRPIPASALLPLAEALDVPVTDIIAVSIPLAAQDAAA